jgi:hypothetical protein
MSTSILLNGAWWLTTAPITQTGRGLLTEASPRLALPQANRWTAT